MKKCSTSLVIKEMQMKTTLRFHLALLRMTIYNGKNNKCWWWCGKTGTLIHCWWGCKLVQPLWKSAWRFLKKLKIELSYDPATPLPPGIYPKECKSRSNRDTCTTMFIIALFIIAKLWKQCRCLTPKALLLESHLQSIYSGHFGNGVLITICPSGPQTIIHLP
jgi:hypothetical protein